MFGETYHIINHVVQMRTGISNYYSTNVPAAHIWSKCQCYLSSVHRRYPAIYIGCDESSEVLLLQFSVKCELENSKSNDCVFRCRQT